MNQMPNASQNSTMRKAAGVTELIFPPPEFLRNLCPF